MWKSTKQRIGIILWKDISEYPWEDVLSWGGGYLYNKALPVSIIEFAYSGAEDRSRRHSII